MSRSNPTPTNPARRFFTWSGSKGELSYYDKELKKNIPVSLPFEFLVLDQLATITGFCEQDSSSYWSNEVRNIGKEEFTVKTSNGTKQVGLYKDLADVRSKGAKYAKSVYVAYKEPGEDVFVIGNLKAAGAALTAWIELGHGNVVENGKCILSGSTEGKKGATVFKIPTFEYQHSDPDEDASAIRLDKELQLYLGQYLNAKQRSESDDPPDSPPEDLEELSLDDVPEFGNNKAEEGLPEPPDFLKPDK